MTRRLTGVLGIGIVFVLAAYGVAQTAARPPAPLDELDDQAWLRSFGDRSETSLDDALQGGDLETTLRLLAALPADDVPEAHLLTLATLARGDDPDLAAAAAQSASRIVEGLSYGGLSARESSVDPEASDAFRALAEDPSARRDLQHAGAYILARLGDLERSEVP